MQTNELTLKHGSRTATVQPRGGRYFYNVWDPKKGFIASGFRKTQDEAIRAANTVLKSK